MNYKPRLTVSRVVAIGTVALVLVAGPLLTGALDAQPPSSRPPPLPVLEQNVDGSGFIRVHEQGTAQVNGTVTVTGGSVAVSNLPSALTVHQAPVIGAYTLAFEFDSPVTYSFPVINATAVHVSVAPANEVGVRFQSPLSDLTDINTTIPNTLLRFREFGAYLFHTFPQPVPLNGVWLGCGADSCTALVAIIGSSQ